MRKVVVPLLSGLLGGAIVAAVLIATGVGGGTTKTTTVVQQAPLSASPASETGQFTPREIYKRDAPGVVFVRAQVVQQSQSPFDLFPQQQRGEATGSGFVIDKAGDILTNAHVIDGAVKVTVQFENDRTIDAKVVGKDTSSDLALLKVDPDGLNLHPLELGTAKNLQVGDPVLAIGNPFGLDRTLTTGVVSALQRRIQAPNGFAIDNVIQTDAAINPGNSGGPLLDGAGRVIGINSQIETGGGGNGNIGIGFAVPIDTAEQVLPALKKGAPVQRAYMGITTRTVDGSLKGLNLRATSGALVQSVEQGSPADKAGLRAGSISAQLDDGEPVRLGGDIITALDDKPVRTADDLAGLVAEHDPGDKVQVHIIRDGKPMTLQITLGSRPDTVQGADSQG